MYWDYLESISGVDRKCIGNISGAYREHIGIISGVCREYIGNISRAYREYIGSISGVYLEFIGSISGMCREYIGRISGVCRDYIGSISGVYRWYSGILSGVYRERIGNVSGAKREHIVTWPSHTPGSCRLAACATGLGDNRETRTPNKNPLRPFGCGSLHEDQSLRCHRRVDKTLETFTKSLPAAISLLDFFSSSIRFRSRPLHDLTRRQSWSQRDSGFS